MPSCDRRCAPREHSRASRPWEERSAPRPILAPRVAEARGEHRLFAARASDEQPAKEQEQRDPESAPERAHRPEGGEPRAEIARVADAPIEPGGLERVLALHGEERR